MSMPNHASLKDDGSAYVSNMTHSAHIDINGETTVKFVDTVVDGTELLAATTTAASTSYDVDVVIDEPYGRSVATTSTDADGVIILHGFDYLGQVMTEQLTHSTGAATGAKAFKRINKIEATTNAGDVVINTGAEYGLPFCAVELVREVVDGAASSEGAITAPVTTTPSATTGDIRGTYNPNTAGDGSKDISVTYITTADLTGGLYGQPQA